MRAHCIVSACLVCLAGVVLTASCVQAPTAEATISVLETDEASGEPPVATKDFSDDPDVDPEGNFSRLALCLFLAGARPAVKEAFCRSLPEPGLRAQCWSKTRAS